MYVARFGGLNGALFQSRLKTVTMRFADRSPDRVKPYQQHAAILGIVVSSDQAAFRPDGRPRW